MENLYDVLGIDLNSSKSDIKRAYALKIREFPPEKEPEIFKKIKFAYDTLIDDTKRKEYDIELNYMDELYELEALFNEASKNHDYKKVIKYCKSILAINDTLYDYLYELILAFEKSGQINDAINYSLELIEKSNKYIYHKNLAKLYIQINDIDNAIKYCLSAYELEPLDETLMTIIISIINDEYLDIIDFLETQIENNISNKKLCLIHFENIIKLEIKFNDTTYLAKTIENIKKYLEDDDTYIEKFYFKLYDIALELYNNDKFKLANAIAENAKDMTDYIDMVNLYKDTSKKCKDIKIFEEFIKDKKIDKDISDIIKLYKDDNNYVASDKLDELRNKKLIEIKKSIIKNPDPIILSIRVLKYKYHDYYLLEEELFETIFDICQDKKILYDQFFDLSFDYNVCSSLRDLARIYELNLKEEIPDYELDAKYVRIMERLEEERSKDIFLSIEVIKDDYFKVYEVIPHILEDIKDMTKARIIPIDFEETMERERNQKIATVYFFFIISLIPSIKYIDILIKIFLENVHISISQWILITLIFVLFIYFIVNKDKNKA